MAEPITVKLDTARLDQIASQLGVRTDAIVRMAALEVVGNAVSSFGTGEAGITYGRGMVRNRDESGRYQSGTHQAEHTASAPGSPPAVDTGTLRSSVRASHTGKNQYTVSDGVEYGKYLEEGTPHMAPRPWLGPSVFQMVQTFNKRWKGLFD